MDSIEKSVEEKLVVPMENGKRKHVLEVIGNEHGCLHRAAAEVLQGQGLQDVSTTSRGRSRSKARRSGDSNFGNFSASQFVETNIVSSNVKVRIPRILIETCEFIRKQIHTEGIFRKSGSSSRRQLIMERLTALNASTESPVFLPTDSVFDVCSAMKQFLRDLPQPLIPREHHNVFVSCLGRPDSDTVTENVLLAVFLLPLQNIHVLCYLFQFLNEVAQHSGENQMCARNLAIVIAPNVMPIEERKLAKGIHQHYERIALDNHQKVVEILIENGQLVGYINDKFETMLGASLPVEGEGTGRKKRHRSGSLTRVFGGIFWKGKSGKDCETPSDTRDLEFKTPDIHTPIIMAAPKKKHNDFTLSSTRRKKTILDAVRSHGLTGPMGCETPNSFITCPSPVVCIDPSANHKASKRRSPNVTESGNFYTPELFGRRWSKRSPENARNNPSSATAALKIKTKLLFGRKVGNKQALPEQLDTQNKLRKCSMNSSKISIHRLARSPRAPKLLRVASRIPVPDSPYSIRKESEVVCETDNEKRDGDYVTISKEAKISDEKNEAFLTSPVLLKKLVEIKSEKSMLPPGDWNMEFDANLVSPFSKLPWNMLNLEGMKTYNRGDQDHDELIIENMEHEFAKTVKESRIIELVSECKLNRNSLKSMSFRVKASESPSQKKIRSARRKSHEVARTPVQIQTPRFMSLRSPKSRRTPPPIVARSPSRCTLRRGQPNTRRTGLARPSSATSTTQTSFDNNIEMNDFSMDFDELTAIRNVTLDRKGRIGRPNISRPALPQVSSQTRGEILNQDSNSEATNFNIRASRNALPYTRPNAAIAAKTSKSSYMAGKLKLSPNYNCANTPSKATRSYSMRDDLFTFNASPMRSYLLAKSQRSGIPIYQYPNGQKRQESREVTPTPTNIIPLKRNFSVQDIIRKFEKRQGENENCPPKGGKSLPSIKMSQFKKNNKISSTTIGDTWHVSGTKATYAVGRKPSVRGTPALKTIQA